VEHQRDPSKDGHVCLCGKRYAGRRALSKHIATRRGSYHGHGNKARDQAGVTVTVRHRSTGRLYSWHRPGPAKQALAELVRDVRGRGWCVQSISTPRTILADLKGRPGMTVGREHDDQLGNTRTRRSAAEMVERALLTQIERPDLVDTDWKAAAAR
jgi:hypothetical protein